MSFTADQLNNAFALATKYIDKQTPLIFELTSPMMKEIMKNRKYIDGGNRLTWALNDKKMDNIGFGTGTAADVIDTGTQRNLTYAELDWKYLYTGFSLTLEEVTKTANSKHAIASMMSEKTRNSLGSTSEFIADALFASAASAPNAYNGFLDIFAQTGTSYAGLTDTDFDNDAAGDSLWLTSRDTSTAAISYTNLDPKITKLKTKKSTLVPNTSVDYMISNAASLSKFKTTQQAQQRFYAAKELMAGFDGINVDGLVWYADEHSQGSGSGTGDNYLYIVNSSTMQFGYKYGFDGKNSPMDAEDYIMPNQPILNKRRWIVGNIMCLDRRCNGVFTVLNPAS